MDGKRGVKEVWPVALTGGLAFGVAQYLLSNHFAYELTDIFSAIIATIAIVVLGRFWQPQHVVSFSDSGSEATLDSATDSPHDGSDRRGHAAVRGESQLTATKLKTGTGDVPQIAVTPAEQWRSFAPYIVIIALFSIAQIPAVKAQLANFAVTFHWPGLNIVNAAGRPVNTDYVLNYGGATGTLLFISGLLTMAILKINVAGAVRVYRGVLKQFGWAIFTILCVFALSYLMNYSGMIVTLGTALAATGGLFAFLSPIVGWSGVFITGTDAGANALFGQLQATAAQQIGASPVLFGAANTAGGVMGKMISPQNLAVGSAAINMVGQEGQILRKVIGWSVGFLLLTCVLVFLQSTPVLGWMVVPH